LEEEWEDAYASEFVSATFGRDYQSLWCKVRETKPIRSYPAMFINTTEVETGRQCWISNVRASDQMFSASECDLLRSKVNGGLRYSTAVNFSSRFPLFSPAACLPQTSSGNYKLHYVDGGYYENSGAKTMLEIIHALKKKNGEISQSDFRIVPQNINQKTNARKSPPNLVWEEPSNLSAQGHRKVIKPYVILFRFSDPFESNKQVNWLNELNEVGSAMYNSRSAHTKQAVEEMHRLKKELGFEVIELTMSKSAVEVPMNWVLSDRSIDHIDTLISNQWRDHKLEKLCFFDSLYSKVVRPTGPSH